MTQSEKDLNRMLKQANESAEYWETRYRTLSRDVRAYFGARSSLADERKRIEAEVAEAE